MRFKTHINDHFTAFAGTDLGEHLQDEGLRNVSGEVPDIPKYHRK